MRRIILILATVAVGVGVERGAYAQGAVGCVDNHDMCDATTGRDCSGWLYVDKTGGGVWFATQVECQAYQAKVAPKKAGAKRAKAPAKKLEAAPRTPGADRPAGPPETSLRLSRASTQYVCKDDECRPMGEWESVSAHPTKPPGVVVRRSGVLDVYSKSTFIVESDVLPQWLAVPVVLELASR